MSFLHFPESIYGCNVQLYPVFVCDENENIVSLLKKVTKSVFFEVKYEIILIVHPKYRKIGEI